MILKFLKLEGSLPTVYLNKTSLPTEDSNYLDSMQKLKVNSLLAVVTQ